MVYEAQPMRRSVLNDHGGVARRRLRLHVLEKSLVPSGANVLSSTADNGRGTFENHVLEEESTLHISETVTCDVVLSIRVPIPHPTWPTWFMTEPSGK